MLSFLLLIICVGEVEELCSVHHQQLSIISAGTNTNIDMVYDVKISLNERKGSHVHGKNHTTAKTKLINSNDLTLATTMMILLHLRISI